MEQDPARIAEQAAEYFARRVPGARPPGRDGLDEWLRAGTRHAAIYEETRQAWNRLEPLRDDSDLQALMHADLRAERRRQRGGRYLPSLAAAAMLVAVLGGGYFYAQRLAVPVPVSYATGLGERRTEMLADGSQIVLNTGTVLQARYARNGRQVDLQQGEAQFDVARDAARPFTVLTGDARITALGTRFQVRHDEGGRTRVTLLEGRVEVVRGGRRRLLAPNEQASWDPAGAMEVSAIDPEMAVSWLEGRLRFRGTPLAEVIAEANRYSTHRLRLGDPELAGVELSGVFAAGDNVSIASAAAMILPVKAEVQGAEIVLLPR